MAEIKNTFLGSKMNKDVDDRLLPNNEYRHAVNIAISESEDSDVGAVENIVGNLSIGSYTDISDAKVIGSIIDEAKDNIYFFFTNFTDTSKPALYQRPDSAASQNCAIVLYNVFDKNFKTLVKGPFLNFSTTHKIFGISIIEDLLFWTDNRNQPRKINVNTATNNPEYYTTEDHISVAKYAPFRPISLYEASTTPTALGNTTMKDVTSLSEIDGKVGRVLEDTSSANTVKVDITYGFPFEVGEIIHFGGFRNFEVFRQITAFDESTGVITFSGDALSVSENDYVVFRINDEFIKNYSGDPKFLEEKFARFSYRIKFDDNEYSIMAPFTQTAFIPKQDGYFIGEDEKNTKTSAEVAFMTNKVNFIELNIPLPEGATSSTLKDLYKVKEIDILYKESDSLAVKIVDTVTIADIEENSASNATHYKFDYLSTKPILTLPSSETTRAYDKTPVKAQSQEVTGNRLVYGNYVDKHTAPKHLFYKVTASPKLEFGSAYDGAAAEYPQHTLKRGRNYQVGFILSDKFGRQSDVILSSAAQTNTSSVGIYGASTVYFPRRKNISTNEVIDDLGNSLKIRFEQTINATYSPLDSRHPKQSGDPGLYNELTNPLGWYSYKVVVKQLEQDYYNVYVPGIINGKLTTGSSDPSYAFTTLISDNINKVPKELVDVSATQSQFNSKEKLFCVVDTLSNQNVQYFSNDENSIVTTISSFEDMGGDKNGSHPNIIQAETNPFVAKIQTPSEMGTVYDNSKTEDLIELGVFETTPALSALDIYYETSTTGLISDLNQAVLNGTENLVQGFSSDGYDHRESQDPDGSGNGTGDEDSPWITDYFQAVNDAGDIMPVSEIVEFEVKSNSGTVQRAKYIKGVAQSGTQDFELVTEVIEEITNHRIKIIKPFYYGVDADTKETYTFIFRTKNSGANCNGTVDGAVENNVSVSVNNVTSGKRVFAGMEVFNGTVSIGKIDKITAYNATERTSSFEMENEVSINNNTELSFIASNTEIVVGPRSLKNVSPSIGSVEYTHDPQFSTMGGILAELKDVKNGSFDENKDTLDLKYDWDTSYIHAPGAFLQPFSYAFYGDTPLVTIRALDSSSDRGKSITFSINVKNGEISKFYGTGWRRLVPKVRVTDSGGKTATAFAEFQMYPGGFKDGFDLGFDI